MRKTKHSRMGPSLPLTEDERDRLSELTAIRLLVGPLPVRDSAERELLRLRMVKAARYPGGKVGGVPRFNPENVAYVEGANHAR